MRWFFTFAANTVHPVKQQLKNKFLPGVALIIFALSPVFGEGEPIPNKQYSPFQRFGFFIHSKPATLKPEESYVVKKPTEVSGTRGKSLALTKEQAVTNVPKCRQPRLIKKGR